MKYYTIEIIDKKGDMFDDSNYKIVGSSSEPYRIRGVSSLSIRGGEYNNPKIIITNINNTPQLSIENDSVEEKLVYDMGILPAIENYWKYQMLKFSVENSIMGSKADGMTKNIADEFRDVVYYLTVGAPEQAIEAISAIKRDAKYLTDERLKLLGDGLSNFIISYKSGRPV